MSTSFEGAARPDHGLVRAVGPLSLTANVVNYTVGASIFVMPASAAALAGDWAPVAFILAALATLAITLCYAEAGARAPMSGGQAGFTTIAFGPYAGFMAGALTYAANLLAAGAITAAAFDMLATAIPALGSGWLRSAAIACWAVGLYGLVGGRVRSAARFVAAATAIKLIPLVLFIGVGLLVGKPTNLAIPTLPVPDGFGQAILLAIFLFAGVHGALLAGGEIRSPARTVPLALVAGTVVVIGIFVGCQLIAQGLLGDRLAGSTAPLADALGGVSPGLGAVMVLGALISMLGWTASDALNTPRSLFALAADGHLPSWLAQVDPRSLTPRRATMVHLALVTVLAVSGSFTGLAAICAVVLVLLLIGACLAALRLRALNAELVGTVRRLPGLRFAAAVGVIAALAAGSQANAGQLLGVTGLVLVLSLVYWRTRNVQAVSH